MCAISTRVGPSAIRSVERATGFLSQGRHLKYFSVFSETIDVTHGQRLIGVENKNVCQRLPNAETDPLRFPFNIPQQTVVQRLRRPHR